MTGGPASLARRLARHQFVRFLLVGGLNTAFGYAVFALLLWVGMHYTWALLLATVAGVLFNFRTTGQLVFESTERSLLGRFVMVYALVYTANVAGLALLQAFGLRPLAAQALLVLPVAAGSFILNRRYVFANG